MEYDFRRIEKSWQAKWKELKIYQVSNTSDRPKCYVLDMFPYPSGAGLHVGHPLGYIASDIYSRFKRLKGFNVLHPMGFDSFGLPAEQYALDTGQHPAETTRKNIATFKSQLDNIGFCYDWTREVQTSDPNYYKWTQWIFLQLFNSYFDRTQKKARPISTLISTFEKSGNADHPNPGNPGQQFLAEDWKGYDHATKMEILMDYRLAYCGIGEVNWCEALGTVLANDEVVNGVSERGGFPVEKKKLRQWYLRITEYADRLLEGLETVAFSDAMKEMQTNWIGKSEGAEIAFKVSSQESVVGSQNPIPNPQFPLSLVVYTTRPDTIFGVDFMVIAPEHELVDVITTGEHRAQVEEYLQYVKSRSERERMAEKKISGVNTGAFAINPFDGRLIPIWISEYVLAGYGTGAIMAVPCGDDRDHRFAKHFNIPVTNIIGDAYDGEQANPTKDAFLQNSSFLDGLVMKDAMAVVIEKLEDLEIGKRKVNYKMRDAAFSRQRYWGEPFPIKWENGVAEALDVSELPLELPHVESYKPGPNGEGPLANIESWTKRNLETNTMPGYAGSSWYFLRYMDPHNDNEFCSRKASDYWGQVDLYIGGTEHAVGHLLYSRMWTKALYDLGLIGHDEPFKRLLNQGMIQGVSEFIRELRIERELVSEYIGHAKRIKFSAYGTDVIIDIESNPNNHIYLSKEVDFSFDLFVYDENKKTYIQIGNEISEHYAKISFIDQGSEKSVLNINEWMNVENVYKGSVLICKNGFWKNGSFYDFNSRPTDKGIEFFTRPVVEKMSKSKLNTVNPDDLVMKYGADTFRMYEMFLGPVEMSKPWDTKGIEGVHRFLKKFWRLFYDEGKGLIVNDDEPTAAELKVLHHAIRRTESDTERFSFNTAVSGFMIATNELTDLGCHKRKVLAPMLILLASYAPHIAEELWSAIDQQGSVLNASFPVFEEKYVKESSKAYPVAINGKTRTEITIPLEVTQQQVEEIILKDTIVQKWLEGKAPKKVIYVKNKMINIVI